MCGIVGYIGKEKKPLALIDSLERLEYRGYDSCGIAFTQEKKGEEIIVRKDRGKIHRLKELLKTETRELTLGIAHTRWATHGKPTKPNAHPHLDCSRTIALAHNGIIENYQELKETLVKKGHRFVSQTDTEVIAHLLEEFSLKQRLSIEKAVRKTAQLLKGSFAVVVFWADKQLLVGMRKNSPLVAGLSPEGSYFASDPLALVSYARKVIYLEEETIAFLTPDTVQLMSFSGKPRNAPLHPLHLKAEETEKGAHKHFMIKEIYEQPEVLERLCALYVKNDDIVFPQLHTDRAFLKRLKHLYIVGCGTAYHAGLGGKYLIERFTDIKAEIDVSSEFRYRRIKVTPQDLIVAVSQSGETADTLAAVEQCKKSGAHVVSICNTPTSSLARTSHGSIYTPCGPEISVASTKAYTAQLASLFLFSLFLGRLKKTLPAAKITVLTREFRRIPLLQRAVLDQAKTIQAIANHFSRYGCFLFLGRNLHYPSALEGALKLKEISYIPAEGYAAGEMKHGPIALIDEYRAVVCIVPHDTLYDKMISNIEEIKARKGKILAVTDAGNVLIKKLADRVIIVPRAREELYPLFIPLALQLFAYYVASNLHHHIDQPRNLAKSVTVE